MINEWVILPIAVGYLSLLFGIAYYADKRSDAGRSIIGNPYIYTLSIAVYCTSWTFYGSVGRASVAGVGFLPIYIGPTLMAALWWLVLRKIIRISKVNRITSIADFIASRYGKNPVIGGVVTVIAVVGIMPYISLQLKAVAASFDVLTHYPQTVGPVDAGASLGTDTAFFTALILAAFAILFGARHIDAAERHEGMVAAVAFESLVKLVAFLGVGLFVTFGLYEGPGDLFGQAVRTLNIANLMSLEAVPGGYASWFTLTFLAMMAILFLPRQFQVLVVENVNERHLRKAVWLFPLYLLAINLFVLPIAFAGMMLFQGGAVDPDTFVLTLPLSQGNVSLALFVFIGGLSAATSMIIVATVALSTMVCNDLVLPVLLRSEMTRQRDLVGTLLAIRRGSIIGILLLGYLYFRLIGESYALVTIGLVSFAAAAQFAPSILVGIYWRGVSSKGALAGLLAGFFTWAYTLVLPAFIRSGWLPTSILTDGPFGVAWLKPYELFGMNMFDPITHAVFWSMFFNIGFLILFSLVGTQSPMERIQASLFVNVYRRRAGEGDAQLWSGAARVSELQGLVGRFLGEQRAKEAFDHYFRQRGGGDGGDGKAEGGTAADAQLMAFAERMLAGAIGSASARVMTSSVVKGEALSIEGVMQILDETSQVIEYSHSLEQKSEELQSLTLELQEANMRLQELDQLKDEFISTVSHELRTPLTSIRAFSEILRDNPELDIGERKNFLDIIVKETERLTRLINQVLDLAKIESGRADWKMAETDLVEAVREALATTGQLALEKRVELSEKLPDFPVMTRVDRDRVIQVVINLISNAVKFCPAESGRVQVKVSAGIDVIRVEVKDNGPGIDLAEQERIFQKFHQLGESQSGKPVGTGLGLPISQHIIKRHGGKIWVTSRVGEGAAFIFILPRRGAPEE